MKPKMLVVSDAVVASGFARSFHKKAETLHNHWDITVVGINYRGTPEARKYPYDIWPCPDNDSHGVKRMAALAKHLRPSVIYIQQDPWNIPAYLKYSGDFPVIGEIAVDGKNCRGKGLNGLTGAIFWTQFGENEAKLGGYAGKSAVVPLGVDRTIYKPQDQLAARKAFQLHPRVPEGSFIVGNVNRNQPRKRLDLTIKYFCEWVKRYRIDDAYLFLHIAPTGDQGYDALQLMEYYGCPDRLILSEPEIGFGLREEAVALTYALFDVMLTTTQGEGWGLTTLEGMSCGIPQIVPAWSALGEWCTQGAHRVPCDHEIHTPNGINVLGATPDGAEVVNALQSVYHQKDYRTALSKGAIALASRPEYDWKNIGEKFNAEVDAMLGKTVQAPEFAEV